MEQPLDERHELLRALNDDELLRRVAELLGRSRRTEADLVAHLGEIDARRLYARVAAPSMFTYCTEVLHLSSAEAYLRITAARAGREHPVLLTMLADGRLHLSGIERLAPHLTEENRDRVLARAVHRSKREIEELVAELEPRPDAPSAIRRLPAQPAPAAAAVASRPPCGQAELRPDGVPLPSADEVTTSAAPTAAVAVQRTAPSVMVPLAPQRYMVKFTASAELRDKLERLRALMRSSVPDGGLAAIVDAAVTEKLQRLEARRFGRIQATRPPADHPRRRNAGGELAARPAAAETPPASRHIPAAVRRAVQERDGGRCRFVDAEGRRCPARDGLEYHHRVPFGHGGGHAVENVSLLCRTHNRYLAEVDYGRDGVGWAIARVVSAAGHSAGAQAGGQSSLR